MPGPQNTKKQKKTQQKREKINTMASSITQGASSSRLVREAEQRLDLTALLGGSSPSPSHSPEPAPPNFDQPITETRPIDPVKFELDNSEPIGPFLHDPGNGIRVRNIYAFLASPLVQPPSMDDDECAQFAQPEILSILLTMLPKELALITFYNRARLKSRICPACLRLYAIGQYLQPHSTGLAVEALDDPVLQREQYISGACSFICFRAMSFNFPGAIDAWGLLGYEMDSKTLDILNGPGEGVKDEGLGILFKMTRIYDLGMGQMLAMSQPDPTPEPLSENTVVQAT